MYKEQMNGLVTRLKTAKSDIGTAITGKGVTVPSTSGLEAYPALVRSIPDGSLGVTEGLARLRPDLVGGTVEEFFKDVSAGFLPYLVISRMASL